MKEKRADFLHNCKLFLDYLVALKQEPITMSLRDMDKTLLFERRKKVCQTFPAPYVPSRESRRSVLNYLEKIGAIEWQRTTRKSPTIIVKRKTLDK